MASDIVEEALEAMQASDMPDVGAQVRYAGDNGDLDGTVSSNVVCTGVEGVRTTSEEGNYIAKDGIVRFKASDEPSAWGVKLSADEETPGDGKTNPAIMGQFVDVLLPGDTDWDDAVRVKVRNRVVMGGMVRLSVIGANEEY